jgi:hypothetical protein
MTMRRVLVLLLCFASMLAQKSPTPSQADLDSITTRGLMLADYDQAAWHATDAVLAINPTRQSGSTYVCRKLEQTWTCVFGMLSPEKDRFSISYEAIQENSSTSFRVEKHDPPREDTSSYFGAAKAVAIAREEFQLTAQNRPYNAAVLPAPSGRLYVYIVPSQTKTGVYPLGGDARYVVASDGTAILEKRQLHKSILEMNPSASPGKAAGGYHTHVLSDVPEDTDVFYVLTRKPPLPEFIGAGKNSYKIEPNGTIQKVK